MFMAIVIGGFSLQSVADENKTQTKETTAKTTADPIRGVKLWRNRCGSCHNLRDPKDLSDKHWRLSMSHMKIRAGLSGQDTRDILKFLQNSN